MFNKNKVSINYLISHQKKKIKRKKILPKSATAVRTQNTEKRKRINR
jgi:hypothetical protein